MGDSRREKEHNSKSDLQARTARELHIATLTRYKTDSRMYFYLFSPPRACRSLFCVELDRKSFCAGLSLEARGLRYFLSGLPFTKRNSRPCCFRLASRASQNAYEDCLMRNRNAFLSPCQCSRLEVERTTAFLKHDIHNCYVCCSLYSRSESCQRRKTI